MWFVYFFEKVVLWVLTIFTSSTPPYPPKFASFLFVCLFPPIKSSCCPVWGLPLEHGPYKDCLQKLPFPLSHLSVANSSLTREQPLCPSPLSLLEFGLTWACTRPVQIIITAMSSSTLLYTEGIVSLYSFYCLCSQSLSASSSKLPKPWEEAVQYRFEHSAISCSLLLGQKNRHS